MARDKGQIYEASDWFKEALQINQVNIVEMDFLWRANCLMCKLVIKNISSTVLKM